MILIQKIIINCLVFVYFQSNRSYILRFCYQNTGIIKSINFLKSPLMQACTSSPPIIIHKCRKSVRRFSNVNVAVWRDTKRIAPELFTRKLPISFDKQIRLLTTWIIVYFSWRRVAALWRRGRDTLTYTAWRCAIVFGLPHMD